MDGRYSDLRSKRSDKFVLTPSHRNGCNHSFIFARASSLPLARTRNRAKHRKLYVSINQFGFNNFDIVLLDHCEDKKQAFELERQYIKELDSVEFGLNESLGGAGKSFVEHDVIAECYKDLGTARKVAQKLGCGTDTVRAVIKAYDLSKVSYRSLYGKNVRGVNIKTHQVLDFSSIAEAGEYCERIGVCKRYSGGTRQKIANVCNGKNKTAYGFYWKYV